MARRRITVEDDAEILVHWRAGRGIRQIARSLGYARNTVRERIAEATAAGFDREGPSWTAAEWRAALAAARADRPPDVPGGSELAALHEQVATALLSSTAATVWQRLHDGGEVHCSLRTFQRYVSDQVHAADPARLTVLLPDPAFGEAMEIDYGRLGMWTDPVGGKRRAVWAFVATLRASGMHFVRPVLTMDRRTWISCHIEALRFFGGSPRFWIPDNLKTGVLKADLYDPRLNRAYRELAEHYGAIVDPARAAHPKDKPRVERAVPYVRDSFWSGRSFTSFDDIVQGAVVWSRETAPRRRHRVHGITVRELFDEHERPALRPLPERAFALVEWKDAKVHPDCHVAIDRVLYSVPWQHVGKTLQAKVSASLVELYDGDTLVKTHVRDGRRRQTDQGHNTRDTAQKSHHFPSPVQKRCFIHPRLASARSSVDQQPQSASTEMPIWDEAFSPFSSSTRRMTTYRPGVKVCSASFVEAVSPSPKAHVMDLIFPLPPLTRPLKFTLKGALPRRLMTPPIFAARFPPVAPAPSSSRRLPPSSLETFVSDCFILSSMALGSSCTGLPPARIVPC